MSDSQTTQKSLFEEFPPISNKEWEKVITRDLKGADYKDKLRWQTGEGVSPLPFYRRDDWEQMERRSTIPKGYKNNNANSWEIRELIFSHDVALANKQARNALERGADAIQFHLHIRRTEGALGGDLQGLPIQTQHDFSELVKDISIDDTPLHFDAGMASPAILAMVWNECQSRNIDPKNIRGTFSYDPFTYLLTNGHYPKTKEALNNDIRQLARFAAQNMPHLRLLAVDARTYHNAGGTIVQELGYAMAAASEYLSTVTESGIDINQIASLLSFNFSIGSNYFLEIAKFRAARLLWKNLLEAYGGDPENNVYIHGETSRWNKTLYDPYTNMLRTSTEGMSAAIAGCDSMTVLPFDQHFRQPDDFSQRIARNQQLILSEEAYLDKVEDPGAGSYYIEKLTNDIGQAAWQLLQEIESEGGLLQAIKDGTIQTDIKASQQKRDQAIATRGRIFVGTNQYSNAGDKMADNLGSKYQTVSLDTSDKDISANIENLLQDLASALDGGAYLGDVATHLLKFGKHRFQTITPYRGSKPFEELRLATEKHSQTPDVLTLPLGHKKWRKGRSTFTANFFGCVGYNIEEPIGFEDVDAALKAIKEQEPDIVVLCSSDKEYKELVPALGEQLQKLENAPIFVLAGNPKGDIENYKKAGVDEFIYSKCNVLNTLKRFQHKLNIME